MELCSVCSKYPISNKRHSTCIICERKRKGKEPSPLTPMKRTPIKISQKTIDKMLKKRLEKPKAIKPISTPIKVKTPLKRSQTKIKQITSKQVEKRKKDNEYYQEAIEINKQKNGGECICENCFDPIQHPRGINVSHIISKGANLALYHDLLNHFILCFRCEGIWTANNGGEKTEMLIFPESEERKQVLTLKYYNT
jgi:hypothetical protein